MLPRSSTVETGSRTSSPARRGISRGGIQKRRTGPTRVDKDGDLIMESAGNGARGTSIGHLEGGRSSRGRTSCRAGHTTAASRGSFGTQQRKQAVIRGLESLQTQVELTERGREVRKSNRRGLDSPAIYLRVRGLLASKVATNPDGGLRDLLSFLERKASGLYAENHSGVKIKKSYLEGENVIITATSEDLAMIQKLNNVKFAGSILTIEPHQAPAAISLNKGEENLSQEAKRTEARIKDILSARYDMSLKLLNLSGLGQDSGLVQMGMFDAKTRISKLFPVLMVVCDRLFASAEQKRDAIVSITLADNELDTVSNVKMLAQTFPDLQNLDLSRNRIADLRSLESWRWKFRKLQNLRIAGNPIESKMPEYALELVKWFPALQILNDVQVRRPAEAAAMDERSNPSRYGMLMSPIPINGPDFRDFNQIGEGFVRQFFALYDSDRATLADSFYDRESLHSLSVNISAPRSEHHATTHPFPTSTFRQSRNLVKMKALHGQMSRVFRGVDDIKLLWAELPSTKHPDLSAQTSKYLIDCHPLPGLVDMKNQNPWGVDGLILMVHGEFEEEAVSKPEPVLRSFSRTFVLAPASNSGPSIRVVSDLLVLRAWSPLATVFAPEGASSPARRPTTEWTQGDIMKELVIRTQMTPEYATLCLVETGWDLEKALFAFSANKSKLPPSAFVDAATAL